MSTGIEVYNVDKASVVARGTILSETELDTALSGRVKEKLRDDQGNAALGQLLSSVTITDFAQDNLKKILTTPPILSSWRIGECLAECYLDENGQCVFPWPTGRDIKNPHASPAGADLVGFQNTSNSINSHCFAFGEVKTSDQKEWPPNVMYGKTGMAKQLEGLRDNKSIKDALFRYLGYHANGADWFGLFRSSAIRYLNNSTDVSLFGMLIRDVEPKPEDLISRAESLSTDCPSQTIVHLRAIYLPEGSIDSLVTRAMDKMKD